MKKKESAIPKDNNKDTKEKKSESQSSLLWGFVKAVLTNNLFWWFFSFGSVFFATTCLKDRFIDITKPYFALKKVEFEGNEHVSDISLLKTSKLKYKDSIFASSLADVKKRLEQISWIKSVIVQRKLSGEIFIRIAERTPIAFFQSHHKLRLVDSDGVILDNDRVGSFSNLPIIAGEGAEKEAFNFLRCIEKFPKIRRQLVFAVRIGRRRWNIKINRGITIKLPERGLMQTFEILDEISDSNGFFNDDITYLDMRIPDRIIVGKKGADIIEQ